MVKISKSNIQKIGESLRRAGLDTEPLAIYTSEEIPEGAAPMCSIDRCIAQGIFASAIDKSTPALYIGKTAMKGCCPGANSWLGFIEPMKFIKYFVSTGHEKFRGGEGEYLKASPEHVEKSLESVGKITPPGKYIIVQKCSVVKSDVDLKAVLCFGKSEQVRNLSGLIHFNRTNAFDAISIPWGPVCATLITYPAGMAEKAPKETAFVGPIDPTQNLWFPDDYMALSIPIDMASTMHEDLDNSFIIKRPEVAYPPEREDVKRMKKP